MGKIGLMVLTDNSGANHQHWLTLRLGEQWTAAFQVAFDGEGSRRRAEIIELRIVPGPFDSPRQNCKQRLRRMRAQSRRVIPFSFDALHREITARRFGDALAAMTTSVRQEPDPEEWGDPVSRLHMPSRSSRAAGRPGRPRAFYAQFAERYEEIEHDDRRESGASTRAILADEYHVPVTTIGKWIHTARQQDFITPVRRGQRGGRATVAARTLSKKRKK